jgi:AcrR family transcriptional regulator
MPRIQRTPEEVEAVRERILRQAVKLMNEVGFSDFSMRMLARVIKVSPPTLYSYFRDKDELYLCILTEGFSRLYGLVLKAYQSTDDPPKRMMAIARAYVDYGLGNVNFYNLMFTLHVPKYNDYLGTPLEPVARVELETSQQVTNLAIRAIRECAGKDATLPEEDARFLLVMSWSIMHGFIAGINNTLLHYVHEDPVSLKEKALELGHKTFMREVRARTGKKAGRKKEYGHA